jgi:hypothetical protein
MEMAAVGTMKIHFALPSFTDFRDFEVDVLEKIHAEFRTSCHPDEYAWADRAEDADMILFLESATYKPRTHIANLCREPLLQRYAGKLFTYNYQDGAAGFLDGVYVHTEKNRFISGRHKAWSTLWPHNELIYEIEDAEIDGVRPAVFCSFRGSLSSPFRKKLVDHYKDKANQGFTINLIDRWYDHRQNEKRSYIDEILQSRFVLCPKGVCSYTPRFFETMALGRVPVLLADDWVAPENLDLASIAIVVPEKNYADLEEILRSKEKQAEEMGRNGRRYWLKYFSKKVRLRALIDLARSLQTERKISPTLDDYLERWSSLSFGWANAWTLPQRLARRLRITTN